MPSKTIVSIIRRFLREVERAGIPVFGAVLYGSYARGNAQNDSDIDVLIISTTGRRDKPSQDVDILWRLRGRVDYRIEPILVSKARWQTDDGSPMLAAIRQEGCLIRPSRYLSGSPLKT